MSEDLKDRIRNFLVSYDHTVNDFKSMEEYDLWLSDAIELLTETLENN